MRIQLKIEKTGSFAGDFVFPPPGVPFDWPDEQARGLIANDEAEAVAVPRKPKGSPLKELIEGDGDG